MIRGCADGEVRFAELGLVEVVRWVGGGLKRAQGQQTGQYGVEVISRLTRTEAQVAMNEVMPGVDVVVMMVEAGD